VDGLVSAEKILGKTDYDLSPAFMADQFRLDDEQVLSGHRIINRIERVGEFEGMTAWNITNKIPVFDAKGAIIGTAGITRTLSKDSLPGGTVSGFEPALAYMRDHYHRAITNQQLASISKMSLRAFERQFLASFHLTPQKYLRKLRLRIASRALIYTNEALSDVALSCGFADQSHFTREFRRQFGRSYLPSNVGEPIEHSAHSRCARFDTKRYTLLVVSTGVSHTQGGTGNANSGRGFFRHA